MRALPTGTVTFLFTDIEGSTRLLDELGDRYAGVLAEHHRLMRESFEPHGGVEVDTAGDAFFVAFHRASDAVAAAAAAQETLARTGLKVRMGIHTGEPLVTETGYVGMDVHRGARVMSAGHGGQVVISQTTRDLLDSGPDLVDLGEHRLKDLSAPQRLFQLGPGDFPRLKTLHQTNLPVQPTTLVGRAHELAEICDLLERNRLVTLTGPGGSGKTRLALQAAADAVEIFEDGVFWVSLQAVDDGALVESTISQAVGAEGGLASYLARRKALLLLDNLEQVIGCAPELARLLEACPALTLLTTSREPLHIAAEHRFLVDPLPNDEAARLFLERAQAVDPAFRPDGAVAEICRRLDGLPLAIELAAARVSLLPPGELLARLDNVLPLLTGGVRDAPERQQTLRATIEWSHGLLSETEQRLFRSLAVFAGSFELDAALEVAEAQLDTLQALVEKSLVRRWGSGRFGLLETIHEYARDRLEETGDADRLRFRHAEYYLERVEPLKWELRAFDSTAVAYVAAERENLRAALGWAIDRQEREVAERLFSSIWFDLLVHAQTDEGDKLGRRIVGMTASSPPEISAEAWSIAGEFARFRGDLDRAAMLKEASLEVIRPLLDSTYWTPELTDLAHIEARRGNLDRARSLAEEAVALRLEEELRGSGYKGGVAHARFAVANVEFRAKAPEIAEPILEEIIESDRSDGALVDVPEELAALAQVRRHLGKRAAAFSALREGLNLARNLGHEPSVCECLEVSAQLAVDAGRPDEAAKLWGAVERLRPTTGFGDFFHADDHEHLVGLARTELGEAAFSAAAGEGRALEPHEAVDYALASLDGLASVSSL